MGVAMGAQSRRGWIRRRRWLKGKMRRREGGVLVAAEPLGQHALRGGGISGDEVAEEVVVVAVVMVLGVALVEVEADGRVSRYTRGRQVK